MRRMVLSGLVAVVVLAAALVARAQVLPFDHWSSLYLEAAAAGAWPVMD
ncbi:MAG: hypothetical protein ONB30_00340 [candidate division KSB1 bacterium]|nr:hypothetical protein [candidate division KSB1 bacterium]